MSVALIMEEGMSLITLSTEGNPEQIQKFLDEGSDLHERDKRGRTGTLFFHVSYAWAMPMALDALVGPGYRGWYLCYLIAVL